MITAFAEAASGGLMTAQDLALDYFQIYDVVNKEAAGEVLLRGAFDVGRQKMRLSLLDYFATPVSKDGAPYVDRHAHLTWYRGIQEPEPVRAVTLENTFGKLKHARPPPDRRHLRTRARGKSLGEEPVRQAHLSGDRAKRAAGPA